MTIHTARKRSRVYRSYVCQEYLKRGAAACPGSRINVADLESFVVDRIRGIGKDPALVRETVATAQAAVQRRSPELEGELKDLQPRERALADERRNLLDAVAKNGAQRGLFEKLGEVEADLDQVSRRLGQVRSEIAALDGQTIDEEDLRAALAAFDGIWGELVPGERARVLELLIEGVTFDASEGEVEIALRPGGVRTLASENERESA